MTTFKTLLTAAAVAAMLAALLAAVFAGVHNASNRRAEYLDAESAVWECIESGLSRAECVAGVGL